MGFVGNLINCYKILQIVEKLYKYMYNSILVNM